ncbi:MAG: hypothetical protein HLUCCA11_15910 [Phormidesmis priestleyi Ana]|uniref:Uncharacterized protein n=1 Tax=Phormidesmis priestleyi Ana TaxID=1666911 RepID=A0A0N8KMN5_9CYAN|nr:MAG: hypothetical protein HLUCCA11_15910 [Phormidesmis priestleyi Ana]
MKTLKSQDSHSAVLSSCWEEIFPKVDAYAVPIIVERIQDWVGQQPELTKVLCDYAVRYAPHMKEREAEDIVDWIVKQEILADWQSSRAADHLRTIERSLLSYDRRDSLLLAYLRLLQKGKVPLNNSPEQSALLASGLAATKRGRLTIACSLYAEVFNVNWVEAQLPGITKPVAIVSSTDSSNRPSPVAKLYSKIAIVACGLAVLGAAISSYVKESGGEALATGDGFVATQAVLSEASTLSTPLSTPNVASAVMSDRALFDNGIEHAQNSRWVSMMREFCDLPQDSTYFAPAEKRLAQWLALYKEDIEIARDIVVKEKGGSCAIANIRNPGY